MSIVGGRALTAPVFTPSVTVAATSTISAGGGATDWVARAAIRRRSSDDALLLAYYRAEAHSTNVGAVRFRMSDDEGDTWTAEDTAIGGAAIGGAPLNPPSGSGQDAGEPQLYVAPNGDLILHTWRVDYNVTRGGTHQWRMPVGSTDWTYEGMVHFAGLTDSSIVFATDDSFIVDRVTYAGARVYTGGADGVPSRSILVRNATASLAPGAWAYVSTIMDDDEGDAPDFGGQEVGLAHVGAGVVWAYIRDNPHTKSFRRKSLDLGATWGALENVTASVGIAARQRIYSLAELQGRADWEKDPRYVMVGFVHQTSGSSHPRRNAVWLSPDRCETMDGPHYLDSSTEDAGYGEAFWDRTNDRLVVVTYQGTLLAASLKQYECELGWAA